MMHSASARMYPPGPSGFDSRQALSEQAFIDGVLGRRCVAWLLDLVFLTLIFIPVLLVLALFGILTFGLGFAAFAWLPAVPFLYHFLSLLRRSCATPGQAIMGLAVRRDADLGPPSVTEAFVFTVVFYLTLAATGLLLLVALFTVRHRTLHDMASGLVVVRRRALDAWYG
jgi:uncharacterized RDD family membrane protein YckC